MQTVNFGGVDVNLFLPINEIESGALDQIKATSLHPYAAKHVAVMPDTHQGYGVAIGTVLVTKGAVIPNAVGVDIGCGVRTIKTNVSIHDLRHEDWHNIERDVRANVPVGFKMRSDASSSFDDWYGYEGGEDVMQYARHPDRVALQMGTLGGGNHFLEYAYEADGTIWVLVHSGSRGIGHTIAEHFQGAAILEAVPGCPRDLEPLIWGTELAHGYFNAHNIACAYAEISRHDMAQHMINALSSAAGEVDTMDLVWDCPHNVANMSDDLGGLYEEDGEGRFITDLVVHRKGATFADENWMVPIPGSMGTASYICLGKGNREALQSAAHGAGRAMSRSKAKKNLSMEDYEFALRGTYSHASEGTLDEAPMAYKDIDVVLGRLSECVEVQTVLHPILTIKGGGRDEG